MGACFGWTRTLAPAEFLACRVMIAARGLAQDPLGRHLTARSTNVAVLDRRRMPIVPRRRVRTSGSLADRLLDSVLRRRARASVVDPIPVSVATVRLSSKTSAPARHRSLPARRPALIVRRRATVATSIVRRPRATAVTSIVRRPRVTAATSVNRPLAPVAISTMVGLRAFAVRLRPPGRPKATREAQDGTGRIDAHLGS